MTHSYFEGNLNEDLDEGQVGGFGIDPNDVPGIPEKNIFSWDAQFKMPMPTNAHVIQQISCLTIAFNPYEEENLPGSRSSNYASSQEVESAEKLQYKQVY